MGSVLFNYSTSGCPGAKIDIGSEMISQMNTANSIQSTDVTAQSQNTGTLQETRSDVLERMKHPVSFRPDRLFIKAKEESVALGSPTDVTISVASGRIVGLSGVQSTRRGIVPNTAGPLKIVSESGNEKTVEVVPRQLGTVDLEVEAIYADNTIAKQTVQLRVVPSSKDLERFLLDRPFHHSAIAIVMEDDAKNRQVQLLPEIKYRGQDLILGEDCQTIKLTVKQTGDEGSPIIQVDENGTIHALREGTAYVVGDFDGVEDDVKVTVYSKDNAPPGYRVVRR